MALLWADGFDHYGSNANLLQTFYTGQFYLTADNPRTGTNSLAVNGFDPVSAMNFPQIVEGNIGYAYWVDNLGGDQRYKLRVGGTVIADFRPINSGAMAFSCPGGQLYSVPGLFQVGAWNYVEIGWKLATGGQGYMWMRLNGVEIIRADGLTIDVGGAGMDNLALQMSGVTARFDDLVLLDHSGAQNNGPLGDIRCRTIFPDANGPLQAWPVTGDASAYQALGHVPPDVAAHYIAGQNVGDAADFGVGELPINTAYVFGVVMVNQLSKTDAGACTVQPALVSGPGSTDGNPVNPGTGSSYYRSTFPVDPNGGGPWTRAAVNASRVKFTRTA